MTQTMVHRKEEHRNEIRKIFDKYLKESVVDIKRLSDRIIGLRLRFGR